jgi:hypothetical protein
MVYPDLWIGPLIGMPTDTLVTSTHHLDTMEAHFVALHNIPFPEVVQFPEGENGTSTKFLDV